MTRAGGAIALDTIKGADEMYNQPGQVLQQRQSLTMTQELRRAIRLLRFSNTDLRLYVEDAARLNPLVELLPRPERPASTEGPAAPLPMPGGAGNRASDAAGSHDIPAAPPALAEHLMGQIRLWAKDERQLRIAEAFLEALEPYGWLLRDVAEIALSAGCTETEAEAVLGHLQKCDPPGIFARSLAECLRLQAQDRGVLDGPMMALLDRLDLVAEGALSALSDACGVAPDEVASRVKLLRSFDPKPGLAFDDPPQPVRAPDLIATRLGDDWTLALNDATLPSITVREDRLCGAEARTRFVAEALASARGLKRAIEYRNANTLAVAAEIIKRQTPFCARRSDDLAALSLRQIADATGLHESTVSRIVAGVAVQTPRGVLALRDLFCRALEGRDGAPQVSIAFVRSRIRTMIEGERRGAPLTDAAIVKRLAGHGVRISRRTVAKYRAQLGLPGAPERRRRAE